MKTISKLLMVAFVATVGITAVNAQSKIAHIDSQELMAIMPGVDSAQAEIQGMIKTLELDMEALSVEYNKKLEELNQNIATYSDMMLANKQGELQDLERRASEFQQVAEKKIQAKQQELFMPIQAKAVSTIEEVATEQGFSYVLDKAAVLYSGSDAIDMLPLVKAKLGVE